MKIGIMWKNDYPWDVRVEKIARSLLADGHEVHILCANAEGRARSDNLDGLRIHRLPATASRLLNAIISIPFYLNPFWFRLVYRVFGRERIDAVIVRDLPLILVALWAKRRFRLPLILDMAENYPAMYREALRVGGLRALLYRVTKNPGLMESIERRTLPAVNHILVVVEESAQRVMRLGIAPQCLSVVSNTPRLADIGALAVSVAQPTRPHMQLVYTGFVQEGRGLEVVVLALRRLRARGLDVRFRIVGNGNYMKRLEALVKENRLDAAVEFTGWVAHKEMVRHVHEADVGVIPHPKNDHTDTTIPNKLFDYMACGKPVVVSNAAPMERIVTQEQCGLVFTADSADSLAEVLTRLSGDAPAWERMGRNGAAAVRQRFHWERDAQTLKEAVARFA